MGRWALVEDELVVAVVEWDGASRWTPPRGVPVELELGSRVGPGHRYAGGRFEAPSSSSSPAGDIEARFEARLVALEAKVEAAAKAAVKGA